MNFYMKRINLHKQATPVLSIFFLAHLNLRLGYSSEFVGLKFFDNILNGLCGIDGGRCGGGGVTL